MLNISFLELIAFRLVPVICPAIRAKPENYWKQYLIPDRAFPAKKTSNFSEIVSNFGVIIQGLFFGDRINTLGHFEPL